VTHPIRTLSAILALGLPVSAAGEELVVTLPAGRSTEPLYLRAQPAGTHFSAAGVVIYGGESQRFQTPPKFSLLSDPKRDPDAGYGYPSTAMLESWEVPNAERYPLQIRDLKDPSISGVSVSGVQSKDLPWRVVKAMWDGDAIHVKGCSGTVKVSDVFFDNVEDGFGPCEGLSKWSLENAYMRSIRDDAIENDGLVSGEIINCLIDGCYVFLSEQSGPSSQEEEASVVTIRDSLVHVQSQPHDGVTGKAWRDRNVQIGDDGIGRAPGMLFKWFEGAGTIDVRDCVFRVDGVSFNGPAAMAFPPGQYENVTLIWLGKGDYPQPLPTGVKLTRDVKVWNHARAQWIRKLPPTHPAASQLKSPP
jgi:hypothetical protein